MPDSVLDIGNSNVNSADKNSYFLELKFIDAKIA